VEHLRASEKRLVPAFTVPPRLIFARNNTGSHEQSGVLVGQAFRNMTFLLDSTYSVFQPRAQPERQQRIGHRLLDPCDRALKRKLFQTLRAKEIFWSRAMRKYTS
jgi:hypothetical protein